MPLVVHLRSAVCLLGRFPALAGVDLDVGRGEIVLLSGANGAGKTTLLRLVAGLLPLRSGTAEVLGHDLAESTAGRIAATSALVGHETFCYDDLTVRENLRFAAAGRRATPTPPPTPRSSGVGLAASADVDARPAVAGAAPPALARGRARPRPAAPAARRAARRSRRRRPRGARRRRRAPRPREGRTVLLASHELDRAAPLRHARGRASPAAAVAAAAPSAGCRRPASSGRVAP